MVGRVKLLSRIAVVLAVAGGIAAVVSAVKPDCTKLPWLCDNRSKDVPKGSDPQPIDPPHPQ